MSSSQAPPSSTGAFAAPLGVFGPAMEYMVDAAQRSVLFFDVMRQRGDQYREHLAETAPHVLDYKVELVLDGRTLDRPVNYGLVRVVPPPGIEVDPTRRPFVIVDPRAGHGPGIGGFKADSEIGVAFKAGHPCYFVGFLPDPVPGQTIEDVGRAEAIFLEKVVALHPEADGKPCVVGNCQAGWAVMMLAAIRPEPFGPIIIAGSPLSYWAGVHGKNPMRYSGGLLGGSWLTALTSDLGAGKFDGAWLVQNFENQNPANTLWTKQYNLYSKIDTEAPRYLGFERWWGGHVNLNAEEIQFIVDELFIGNNLAAGRLVSGSVAKKEYGEFSSNIDLIDTLPPGLYEAVFESKGEDTAHPELAPGQWVMRCEARTLDDIRALGGNDAADERRFATAVRVSENNLALYREFAQPIVRAFANPPLAQWLQQLHPLRLQYELFSNANPMMTPVAAMAEEVRNNRRPVAADNPFVQLQETLSSQIVAGLNAWRDMIESLAERTFLTVYGSPPLQAAVGIDPTGTRPLRKAGKHPLYDELLQKRIAELRSRISVGGVPEAVMRGVLYVGLPRGSVDERGFEAVRRMRRTQSDISLSEFKQRVRDQFYIMLMDMEAALAALPSMLPTDADARRQALDLVKQIMTACGPLSDEDNERMRRVARAFGVDEPSTVVRNLTVVASERQEAQAKAS